MSDNSAQYIHPATGRPCRHKKRDWIDYGDGTGVYQCVYCGKESSEDFGLRSAQRAI